MCRGPSKVHLAKLGRASRAAAGIGRHFGGLQTEPTPPVAFVNSVEGAFGAASQPAGSRRRLTTAATANENGPSPGVDWGRHSNAPCGRRQHQRAWAPSVPMSSARLPTQPAFIASVFPLLKAPLKTAQALVFLPCSAAACD